MPGNDMGTEMGYNPLEDETPDIHSIASIAIHKWRDVLLRRGSGCKAQMPSQPPRQPLP